MRGREIEIDREKKRGRDRVIDSMGERDERQRDREREGEREGEEEIESERQRERKKEENNSKAIQIKIMNQ